MHDDIWILGATGRVGRDVAADLAGRGIPLVLAGRDRTRLDALRREMRTIAPDLSVEVVVGSFDDQLAALRATAGTERVAGVVVNTVGPFTRTALPVIRALPEGTHALDLSNEYPAIDDVLRHDRTARERSQVLVAGAGFGVTATESVLVRLCRDRPRPSRVRIDAIASVAPTAGTLGRALAESIADVAAFGGGRIAGGRLVRTAAVVTDVATLTTPDGDQVTSGCGASGELRAAWAVSDADEVVAGSAFVPTNPFVRGVLPLATLLFRVPPVRALITGRLAAIRTEDAPRPREHSWARARVAWPSGEVREAWFRCDDGSVFTARVAAEVAARLLRGEGRPGAHTPAALFGEDLVLAAGGSFVDVR